MILKNASIFERGCSPLHAPLGQRATQGHTGGLRSVFSDAHVPGKNVILVYFPACGRENSAEGFYFIMSLTNRNPCRKEAAHNHSSFLHYSFIIFSSASIFRNRGMMPILSGVCTGS